MGFFGVPAFAFDSGNSHWKMIDDRGNWYLTPNAVSVISEREYYRAKAQNQGNSQEFGFIARKGIYYAVGESALAYNGYANRLQGKAKYKRDYIGIAMLHCILNLTGGNPPKQFAMMGAHPPLDDDQKEEIIKAFKGKWKFSVFGQDYELECSYVDSVDEITGGAMHVLLNDEGARIQNRLNPSQETLVFDLGGGTMDIVRLNRSGIPIKGTHNSARIGINDMMLEFQDALNQEFKALFKDSKGGIPLHMVYDIALNPDKQLTAWAGEPLDCKSLWQESIAPTLATLYASASQMLDGGITLSAPQVLLTGGGAGVLYQELCDSLFPTHAKNNRVFACASLSEMILGNVYGMRKNISGLRVIECQLAKKGR